MKVLIFGSKGMVGSSVAKIFSNDTKYQIVLSDRSKNNLFDLESTKQLIEQTNPSYIINAAAKVGGIYANNEKRFDFDGLCAACFMYFTSCFSSWSSNFF